MKKSVLTFGAAAAALAMTVPMTAVAATEADRYAGADRYNTAISVASAFGTSDVVYLSRGDSQADAVAGGKLPNGPLLLVNDSPTVQKNVAEAITKLKATKVVVLGGTGSVSDAAVKAVAGKATVTRIAGANRFETAAEISKNLFPEGKTSAKVYLANGITLVDALVGGTMTDGAPILLTSGSGTLPAATLNEIKRLKPSEVVALGGEGAVLPAELSAAATANGAGGGMSKADAENKVKADLAKAEREAELVLKGWYTLADGKTADDFVKSGCTIATDETAKKAAKELIATTFPRLKIDEVKADCADAVFKVDGQAAAGKLADAKAKAQDKQKDGANLVATFKGLEKVDDEVQTKSTDKTEKAESTAALAVARADLAKAQAAKATGPTTDAVQAYMGGAGAKASRIAGANRYLTALEIAKTQYPNGANAKALYVANGMASADATVAGFLDNKAELAGPVLLAQKDSAPAEVTDYAKAARAANAALAGKFKGLGGVGVVSDSLVDQFKGLLK
ncbi:cell wall-binding repeat-containing protein [uncultured Mobiluncus sp.]|uniref:cell wall-binding repeat-containing protein n=1 Tax=uncultured Mobiluncus sp. TaxID=293425 RepID=UPI00261A311B|nr:cell wall-binding repeat-containing protein [uncultured Mobiluncus sp.]